ncbi:MAG: amidase [Betaproteobacteria bacterium]
MSELTDLTADALSRGIAARAFSCRELMVATLARIESVNPRHNAIVSLRDPDDCLRDADACDAALDRGERRGFLHGIPQAIKDAMSVAGVRSTLGSPLVDFVPSRDDLVAERMKASGAIVIGRTNCPEFGLGSHTFNEIFGTTLNPWDRSRSAGGSSGGAAVALATRMLAVADGSDFMGSLRNPAGWNNVYGMRPSQGRVPNWPVVDAWVAQLSTCGPMARTVLDLAHLLDVQAGYDPRVPLSLDGGGGFADAVTRATPDNARVRIGWLADLDGYLAMEAGVLATCEATLRRFENAGATVESVAQPFDAARVWDAWLVWRRWLVAGRIAPFLADPSNRARIKPEALWEVDQAAGLTGGDTMRASVARTAFHHRMLGLLGRFDLLALPTAQAWPFDANLRWPREIAGRAMDTYHRWMETTIYATFAGLPCIAVPAGFGAEGLPMGLQLIGRPRADADLLRIAAALEPAIAGFLALRPPEPA